MLKIAIQKSGRLYEQSIQLLKQCGLSIDESKGQLKASVANFPAEILFLRNADIPGYVQSGVVDMAIVGDNVVLEKEAEISKLCPLGFSKCRLSIATAKDFQYSTIADLAGKKIATSYPNTLRSYLQKTNIEASVHRISGSVEIAPNIGLADAICDLVSSGSTLFKNNLVEQEILFQSEASLYANQTSLTDKKDLIADLLFRVEAVNRAKNFDYILFNIPTANIEEASKILPSLKSPTVMPLLQKGWSSVHSVVKKSNLWSSMNLLKEVGAEGILVSSVQKMVL